MRLNIKSNKALALAKELSQLTGLSLTVVVIDALQVRLEQLKHEQANHKRAEELMTIGARCAAHIHRPMASTEHDALLYGGLLYDDIE